MKKGHEQPGQGAGLEWLPPKRARTHPGKVEGRCCCRNSGVFSSAGTAPEIDPSNPAGGGAGTGEVLLWLGTSARIAAIIACLLGIIALQGCPSESILHGR
jgi:hypothetical protein